MILAALALPYPGRDSSRVETFMRATIGSPAFFMTAAKDTLPALMSARRAARFARASAAFLSAAWRSASDRFGSAMGSSSVGPLHVQPPSPGRFGPGTAIEGGPTRALGISLDTNPHLRRCQQPIC